MEKYYKTWRLFFAVSIIAIAVQQLICKDFRPVIVPPAFPAWLSPRMLFVWMLSLYFIVMSILIIFNVKARKTALWLAFILLFLVLFFQVIYELNLYPAHLGVWSDPLKELTLSGGAFVVAGSLSNENYTSGFLKFLNSLVPLGKYFLAITMVLFGIDHFIYPEFVKTLIPTWIPGALFWTYFAGIALILSGIAIIINFKRKLAAILLGIMIFVWLLILHIPRAIIDPHSGAGNEWTSVFEALAFSSIASLIASESTTIKHQNSNR